MTTPHPAFAHRGTGDIAVIACHFNPCGYQRPRANLRRFLDRLAEQGVPVFMSELVYGDQVPVLPVCDHVQHFQTEPDNLLFHKENLLNLTERIVPEQYKKLVWLDAECLLSRADWLEKTSEALDQDEVSICQPWRRAILTDEHGKECGLVNSTGYGVELTDRRVLKFGQGNPYHPGFATAASRALWAYCGGLYELPVSCADTAMALGLLNALNSREVKMPGVSAEVWEDLCEWSTRAYAWSGGYMGCIRGDITHLWHGDIKARAYPDQPALLANYDPAVHTAHRSDGLLEWTPEGRAQIPETIAAIAARFAARQEDGKFPGQDPNQAAAA